MLVLNDYQLELGMEVKVLVPPFISQPFARGDDSEVNNDVDDDDDDDDDDDVGGEVGSMAAPSHSSGLDMVSTVLYVGTAIIFTIRILLHRPVLTPSPQRLEQNAVNKKARVESRYTLRSPQ